MTLPIAGNWTVDVQGVRPFTIHGDLYYELQIVQTTSGHAMLIRIPQHASPRPPEVGDRLKLTFLMGQVTGAVPVE